MIDDQAMARVLAEHLPGLIAAYRYGSTVAGATHAESDVDVAVLAAAVLSGEERLALAARLAEVVRRDVDLVDLRPAPTVLRMQVVAHGVALEVGDAVARGAFEDFVYSDYARLNEERREILEQVHREGTIHGR